MIILSILQKLWVDSGQTSPLTSKRNIHGSKVLLCIWWDMKSITYYELNWIKQFLLSYQQLINLNCALNQKRPIIAQKKKQNNFIAQKCTYVAKEHYRHFTGKSYHTSRIHQTVLLQILFCSMTLLTSTSKHMKK